MYGNQTYLLAGLFTYNLLRELQMQTRTPSRRTTAMPTGRQAKRACLWVFERVDTVRKTLLQRAGRLTLPQGRLTLTISAKDPRRNKLNVFHLIFRPSWAAPQSQNPDPSTSSGQAAQDYASGFAQSIASPSVLNLSGKCITYFLTGP